MMTLQCSRYLRTAIVLSISETSASSIDCVGEG
jgi:hypothetical protein